MSNVTIVDELPNCDFCRGRGGQQTEAHYGGRTVRGSWSHMCDHHFALWGVGTGLGRGQRLLTPVEAADEQSWPALTVNTVAQIISDI